MQNATPRHESYCEEPNQHATRRQHNKACLLLARQGQLAHGLLMASPCLPLTLGCLIGHLLCKRSHPGALLLLCCLLCAAYLGGVLKPGLQVRHVRLQIVSLTG